MIRTDLLKRTSLWACIFSFMASMAQADGFLMWQAQRDGTVIHLLASIDFLTPDSLTTLAPEILDAFGKSSLVFMEYDMDQENRRDERRKIYAATSYSDGDNLLDHLPQATIDRFDKICSKLVIHNRAMIRVKPWAAAYNLRSIAQTKLVIPLANKMDHVFYTMAVRENKPIDFLNAADEVILMFNSISDEINQRVFEKALRDIENMSDTYSRAEAVWRAADADAASKLVNESYKDYPDIREAISSAGNKNWAGKLESQVQYDENIFALISLDHLVGKDGLLEKLKAHGFLIAQVIPE